MQLFGLTITRTKGLSGPYGGGWYPLVIREPYTGAWQKNEEVRPETLLSNPTVFRCINLITTDIGKTPCRLVREDANGIWTETSSPAFSPVLRRPNRYQTPQQFFEAWVGSKLIYGDTFVYKERDARGVVHALYVLNPARVRKLVGPDGSIYYDVNRDELSGLLEDRVLEASDIIHDRWNCLFHQLNGISPLYASGGAALQYLKIQEASTRFFANNSQPAGIVYLPGSPGKDQVAEAKASLKEMWGGVHRGETGVLTGGATYESISQSATDSQLTEQMRQLAQTIAGVWGVPISFVDSSQQPPYANSEATQLQYRSQCLQTLMTAIENLLDDGLELPAPYGTEFDIDALIWMDTATKTKAAQDAIGAGAMAPNEARKKYFGLGPVEGGDACYLQQQYSSLEAHAKRDEAPTPPAGPPQVPVDVAPDPELDDDEVPA